MTGSTGSEHPERQVAPNKVAPPTHKLREVHSHADVKERIRCITDEVFSDFGAQPFLMVVIEKGGRRFASHLVEGLREQGGNPEMLYLRARRTDGQTLGDPKISLVESKVFRSRRVLVVDDIIDEGRTLEAVLARINRGDPESVSTAVLVSKVEQRKVEIPLDYVGFELVNGWVVGWGMDLDQEYRELNHLAIVEPE